MLQLKMSEPSAEVKLYPLKSSHLAKVGYDAKTKTLHVIFKDGDHYVYHGVSQEKFNALLRASSAGTHFHKEIKPHHPATKMTSQ